MVKQWKEETEAFFNKLFKPLHAQPMNLSKVSSAWNSTSWLWDYKPTDFVGVGYTPNGAAMFKVAVLGEVDIYLIPLAELLAALKAMKMEFKGADALTKIVKELTLESTNKLLGSGMKVFHQRMTKETVLFVPPGCMFLEAA